LHLAQRAGGVGRIKNRADFSDADRGIELHQRLSAFGKPIPTVLIKGYPDDGVGERAPPTSSVTSSKHFGRMTCSLASARLLHAP
jgi:hypothetical protein